MASGDDFTGFFTPNAISRAERSPVDPDEWEVERADEPGSPARIPDEAFRELFDNASHGVQEGLIDLNEAFDAASYARIGAKNALAGDFGNMEFSYRDLRNSIVPLGGSAHIVFNRTGATRLDPASHALAEECAFPTQDARGRLISPSRRRPMSEWMTGEDIPIPAVLHAREMPSPFEAAVSKAASPAPVSRSPHSVDSPVAEADDQVREDDDLARAQARLEEMEERYRSLVDSSQYDAAESLAGELEELRQDIADLEDPHAAEEAARAAEQAQEQKPARRRGGNLPPRKGRSGPVAVKHIDPKTGLVVDGPSPAAERARQSRGQRDASWILDLANEVASAAKQAKEQDPGTRFFVANCLFDEFSGGDVEALLKGDGALDGVAMPGLRTFRAEPAEDGRTRIVVPSEDAADARSTASGMNMVYRVATGEGKDLFDHLDGLDDGHAEASLEVPGETPEQRERFAARIAAGIDAELLVSAPDAFVGYDEETSSIRIEFPLAFSSQVEEAIAAVAKAEKAKPSEKQAGPAPSRRAGVSHRRAEGKRALSPKKERKEPEPLRYLDAFLPIDSIKGDGPRIAEGLPKPRQGNGDYYIVALPQETFIDGRDLGGYTFTVPERLVTATPDGTARLRVSENSTFSARLTGTDQAARVTAPELWGAFAERALIADKPVYGKISTLRHVVGDGGRRGRDGAGLPAPKAGKYGPYYDVMIPADEARAVLPGEEVPDGAHLFFSVRAADVDPQGLITFKGRDRVSLRLSERAPGGLFKTTRRIAADAAPLMSAMAAYVDEHPQDAEPKREKTTSREKGAKRQRVERARSERAVERDPTTKPARAR